MGRTKLRENGDIDVTATLGVEISREIIIDARMRNLREEGVDKLATPVKLTFDAVCFWVSGKACRKH